MKRQYFFLIILILAKITAFADGVLVSSDRSYPGLFLKNKSTEIYVDINGLIAETTVIQEFENEWNKTVDAVYNYPLPLNARAIRLQYSIGDTIIDALLQEMPQTTTPGTGEGGIIAELNKYMGKNCIKLQLTNIFPGGIKWLKLIYIQEISQSAGVCKYTNPFDTENFLNFPLDYLKININIYSEQNIINFDIPSHSEYYILTNEPNHVEMLYVKPQTYQTKDIEVEYQVENSNLAIDFYSFIPAENDGYFTFVGHSPILPNPETILPTNIIFLLCNSSSMMGNKLNISKLAISEALDELTLRDSFNIITFNSSIDQWETEPVIADAQNIADAKTYLESITAGNGSDLETGLNEALNQVASKTTTSSILVFTDGYTYVDPYTIADNNLNSTGIFFIAIGKEVDYLKIEEVAKRNYGFVSYLTENDNLKEEINNVFRKINKPLYKNVIISHTNTSVYDIFPSTFTTIYANSDFIFSGRYSEPGISNISVYGLDNNDIYYTEDFSVDFSNSDTSYSFSRIMWSKFVVDDKETQLLIYGDNDVIKQELIEISLNEKIKCRYTAYVEDTTFSEFPDSIYVDDPWVVDIIESSDISESCIMNTYPNPVSEILNIKFFINENEIKNKLSIKIYDLTGKLIYEKPLSDLNSGISEICLNLIDLKFSGNILIVRLESENKIYTQSKVLVI